MVLFIGYAAFKGYSVCVRYIQLLYYHQVRILRKYMVRLCRSMRYGFSVWGGLSPHFSLSSLSHSSDEWLPVYVYTSLRNGLVTSLVRRTHRNKQPHGGVYAKPKGI